MPDMNPWRTHRGTMCSSSREALIFNDPAGYLERGLECQDLIMPLPSRSHRRGSQRCALEGKGDFPLAVHANINNLV